MKKPKVPAQESGSAAQERAALAARLQFTDADRRAFAFMPPGPESVEAQAARGVEWAARAVESCRAGHADRSSLTWGGSTYLCQVCHQTIKGSA